MKEKVKKEKKRTGRKRRRKGRIMSIRKKRKGDKIEEKVELEEEDGK